MQNRIDSDILKKTVDFIYQFIDIPLNYRQSGHPGGSHSKAELFLSLLLSGNFRWDIRDSQKRFRDRFVLGCGHTVPLVYATLAVLNQTMRVAYEETGSKRYAFKDDRNMLLFWEDLVSFRRLGGLSGHAEAYGKTSILATNTGASAHGTPAAAGLAFALKRAGAGEVRVFLLEGEGGLTPGATHETLNSAWGMALDNLHFLVDWNDYGIDSHKTSDVVFGTPDIWFSSHGWKVVPVEDGTNFSQLFRGLQELVVTDKVDARPSMLWARTRKGNGYGTFDNVSHGTPHPINSPEFWELEKRFSAEYEVDFVNVDGACSSDPQIKHREFHDNLKAVAEALGKDKSLCLTLADRLIEIGDSVPESIDGFKLERYGNPFADSRFWNFTDYPSELWKASGEKVSPRVALSRWGAFINSLCRKNYDRPMFLAASADLAESTGLGGFAQGFNGIKGYGWYNRVGNDEGILAPSEITEFSNAGMLSAVATLNLAKDSKKEFDGFYGVSSSYDSFSYLAYGPLRLFSQFNQDTDRKSGKFMWVGSHTGPETADDSRTHFGIFSPMIMQCFPRGSVINLYPWEYNEVPVLLGAAFCCDIPLIVLHVSRSSVEIPDRKALGIPSHYEAARGAYILRDYDKEHPQEGTFYVQGQSAVASIITLLSEIDRAKLNIKIVCVTSTELFGLQDEIYQSTVVTAADKMNSTFITTQSRRSMMDWSFNSLSDFYALSSDYDEKWRSGGTLEEVLDDAHMTPKWIFESMKSFITTRKLRLQILSNQLGEALNDQKHNF